jgi:exodeoxyribonuclease VIII
LITLLPGANAGLSNTEYHSEKLHLSSSNLKMLLQSPQDFYQAKILGNSTSSSSPAMDLGSYVHSLVLEPEKVAEEFAIYEGWRKAGPDYQSFLQTVGKKIVLSKPQAFNGQRLAKSVEACPPALDLLKGGVPELSHAAKLFDVPVKMRADYLNIDAGYIVDVKTTRWGSDVDTFRRVVRELGYELSAALYCDIAYQVYGKVFDFYWVVLSKADWECQVYRASTHTLSEGSALVNKALITYKKCLASGQWPDNLDAVPKAMLEHEILEI